MYHIVGCVCENWILKKMYVRISHTGIFFAIEPPSGDPSIAVFSYKAFHSDHT